VRVPERRGGGGFGGARACGQSVHRLGVLLFVGLFLLVPAAFANASSFTWAGGSAGRTESAAHWSLEANWEGATAPMVDEAIETLSFLHLTNSECASEPPKDTCYLSLNDLSGLSVASIQLDDADDYLLAGNKITLGKGGLTASPEASGSAGDFIELPLQLSEPQKWSIAGRSSGAIEENGLFLGGDLTGSDALTTELSNRSALFLDNDTKVGPVTIEGPPSTKENIDNGVVSLEDGELNSANHQSVDLSHVFFEGTGAVGSLGTNHATLDLGNETGSAGGLEASNVELDSASGIIFKITGGGSIAQTDYSQLVSQGPTELAGAIVVVVGKSSAKASCPVLAPGQTYTFVTAAGMLSGSFADAFEDEPEISIDFAESCGSRPAQTMRIKYNRSGSTETVTGIVEEAAVKKKHEEEVQKEEALRGPPAKFESPTPAPVTGNVEAVSREATAAAARRRQEEETIAAENKKIREEEAATKKQEEKAKSLKKPVTRAQLLAKALKTCKKQPKKKRAKCEATAKKKYEPQKKIKKGDEVRKS
jgi:hypothetical protein